MVPCSWNFIPSDYLIRERNLVLFGLDAMLEITGLRQSCHEDILFVIGTAQHLVCTTDCRDFIC